MASPDEEASTGTNSAFEVKEAMPTRRSPRKASSTSRHFLFFMLSWANLSPHPTRLVLKGVEGPLGGPDDTPMIEEASLGGRPTPESNDNVPLARFGGQDFVGPIRPRHVSEGKVKAAAIGNSLEDSSSKDDYPLEDMDSKMRYLVGGSFGGTSSDRPQAKAMLKLNLTHVREKGSTVVHRMKLKAKEAELKAKKEACTQVIRLAAMTSRFEKELEMECLEKQLALDGYQAIKDEYLGLTSEVLYEVYLHNPKVYLGYIGSPFRDSSLCWGKEIYESRLLAEQADLVVGQVAEAMADQPVEAMADHPFGDQVVEPSSQAPFFPADATIPRSDISSPPALVYD
uniref:Uncharacterized protein n=1 Tax=Cannabis sativa TaxID=3483 RepID=A0A803NJ66_CANSA